MAYRRPARTRGNSLWEEESSEYWKKHDTKGGSNTSLIAFVAFLVLLCGGGGVILYTQAGSDNASSPVAVVMPSESVREQCRKDAISSAWHQTSCENLCASVLHSIPRPTVHRACMDGCTYGTITATKGACTNGTGIANENCPIEIPCENACKPYDQQVPRPTLKNTCSSNCRGIASASCSRATGILHNLFFEELDRLERKKSA